MDALKDLWAAAKRFRPVTIIMLIVAYILGRMGDVSFLSFM